MAEAKIVEKAPGEGTGETQPHPDTSYEIKIKEIGCPGFSLPPILQSSTYPAYW